MFDYCGLVDKQCPYATKYKGYTHCGLQTGNQEQNKVIFMRQCPKENKKRRKKLW